MTTHDSITLVPLDLTDMFGFGDGDLGNDLLDLWLPTSVWAKNMEDDSYAFTPLGRYLRSTTFLVALVEEHLLPTIPERFQQYVKVVHATHNPVRFEFEHMFHTGSNVDDTLAEIIDTLEGMEPVNVTWDVVSDVAGRVYPLRPNGWLSMYSTLIYEPFWVDLDTGGVNIPAWKAGDYGGALRPRIDQLASEWSDDELFLAADLLASNAATTNIAHTREDMNAALHTARLVLN